MNLFVRCFFVFLLETLFAFAFFRIQIRFGFSAPLHELNFGVVKNCDTKDVTCDMFSTMYFVEKHNIFFSENGSTKLCINSIKIVFAILKLVVYVC
jgi:hypothetical protein